MIYNAKLQNLSGSRIGATVGHLLAFAGSRTCIYSCDIALDHVVFLLRALPLCLMRRYIAHMRILDWDTETFYNIAIASCAEGLAPHFSAYLSYSSVSHGQLAAL